ncbi:mechanosensitive ion channel family protein [Chitinimonas sp.]|uniref:mechanosensitive ion channel family protein n=1 Tax=Chitinimonas sp. TaxID=1934313 RepID=UPI0035B33C43
MLTLDDLARQEWPYLLPFCMALLALLYRYRPAERRNVVLTLVFLSLSCLGLWLGRMASAAGLTELGPVLHEASAIALGMVIIRLLGLVVFRLGLAAIRLEPPRILEDVLVFVAYLAWGLVRLRYAGLDLTSLVTTSAVLTAVAAFSMQDTLGNILSGIALQLDDSLELGQWVKLNDISGRVLQIGWRSTLIETRNGETVVVPNGWLMKNSFQIIGKRFHGQLQWRRWVWFELDWDHAPSRVLEVMQQAVHEAQIAGVAAEPPPQAGLMETKNGVARYALRYWLTDFARDDPTDSQVRSHVIAALSRNGLALAADSHHVLMTKDNDKTAQLRHEQDLLRRLAALHSVSLFDGFTAEELRKLADQLVYAPFESGDVISRQGAVAHWLYILTVGEVEIWHDYESAQRQLLGRLSAGNFFGEMGLMTGAPRSATVIASSYVECYRLDHQGFDAILSARPALADAISNVLACRLAENQQRAAQHHAPQAEGALPGQSELLARIRHFFSLE